MVPVAELLPFPRNPAVHGPEQVAALARIIAHQGWRSPIVASRRSGFIVSGHGRLAAAKQAGWKTVPVNWQEFASDADEWAHVIADNKIQEQAGTSYELLAGLLKEMPVGFDLLLSGLEQHSLDNLLAADWKPPAVSDESSDSGGGRIDPVHLTTEARLALDAVKVKLGEADDVKAIVAVCRHYCGEGE